jgi:sugar lactone lactonase YvrE
MALIIACGVGQSAVEDAADNNAEMAMGDGPMVPMFEVDPLWPKNLPNHGLMGPTIGVDVDSTDTIWLVHRNTPDQFVARTEIGLVQDPPLSECCQPAPPVLAFDQEGNLVHSWGGPGTETGDYVWPASNHGITIDHMDNVWIGGNGAADSHVVKFTQDGTFLMQIGIPGARQTGEQDGRPVFTRDSMSMDSYGRVAKIGIDPGANEAYFADGYFNKRVAVVDVDTGELKRYWGAYGNEPDDDYDFGGPYQPGEDGKQQFRGPVHCSEISNDGLVYICDRAADRIQVFQKDGTFVEEVIVAPNTLSQGSTWDIDFSPDAEQKFMYLADGQNMKVYIIDRASLEVLTAFGDGGRQPGMFFAVHSIAVDSDGNIYTTETYEGSRIQKFVYTGMGPVPPGAEGTNSQGVLWPTN